ncbi:MAG TPA: MFS transporter [Bryobacteraceae bacterium]|nr:MFS transporter [Bryobacteraceae bacterium]
MLFLLSIVTCLDRMRIPVAGPRMQADLGITPQRWGWVVGAFTLSCALFEIQSGALGDRIGRRPPGFNVRQAASCDDGTGASAPVPNTRVTARCRAELDIRLYSQYPESS